MEGDVEVILPRPSLPYSPSRAVEDAGYDDAREQSQQKKEREARDEVDKWDAWHACAGLSKTEAKRRYVEVLIETMKVYAAGTAEARELVDELEFVWNQIRSQSGSEESLRSTGRGGVEAGNAGVEEEGRLRVLSPVSRGGSGEIVEGEDATIPERDHHQPPHEDEDDDDSRDAPDGSERNPQRPLDRRRRPSPSTHKWRRQIETALTKLSTEMAAIKEQVDELNSSSYRRSRFSIGRRKGGSKVLTWIRWVLWIALRQLAADALVMGALLLWVVWRGSHQFENWVTRRWAQLRYVVERASSRGGGPWDWDWARLLVRVLPARFL